MRTFCAVRSSRLGGRTRGLLSLLSSIEPALNLFCLRCCRDHGDQVNCSSHRDRLGCENAVPGAKVRGAIHGVSPARGGSSGPGYTE
ncbi:hypothetical protein K488DRAFT_58429 [Vararia minispora EC-137]|uniref:Uncharacterized protein n=1 Tax=Vararia minispora EC-137 TaxID=1314806 RepID=A0ACB8QA06_9AGAM|nr:hypothetical protein K488DRAFT_58429 [Vararia minispora EC-137]